MQHLQGDPRRGEVSGPSAWGGSHGFLGFVQATRSESLFLFQSMFSLIVTSVSMLHLFGPTAQSPSER